MHRGARRDRFVEELLADGDDLKIALHVLDGSFPPTRLDGRHTLSAGWLLVWYLFPGRSYEIGAFHDRLGRFRGYYTNLIRPARFSPGSWVVEDLFVDVWQPVGGEPVVLDEADLAEAEARGEMDRIEAEGARALARDIAARARAGDWPPREVRDWPADLVPALRLRRDSPGTFFAARISGRIIAYGLYLMGAVSATSIVYAAFSDAFVVAGRAQDAWLITVVVEAVLLAPLALGGKLPATRWPRPALRDERSLFVATLAAGLAVLAVNERAEWSEVLLPVYATLGLFSSIFAVCRAWFDRAIPVFALAGVAVTLVALWILL